MSNINRVMSQSQALEDNENFDEAYQLLEANYDEFKNNPEFLEKIAVLAKTTEKNEEAAKYWEELVVINPNNMLAYSELLDIYIDKDKFKYYMTRAKYKILNGKLSQSVDDYKKAIDSTSEQNEIIEARFMRAKAFEELGKTQPAIDEYYRIVEHEDNHVAYLKLADLYNGTTDRISAISVLQKGFQAFPEDKTIREFLANLLIKENRLDEALECTQDTLVVIKIKLLKNENQEALDLLNNLENKNIPQYHALMAEYYFNTDNFDKSIEEISEFKKLSPQNPLSYQMLALICDKRNDRYGYHYNMGRCYSLKQDFEMALNEYLNAHQADESGTEAMKEIIKINETANNPSILMEFYEKLLKKEPDNIDALKGLSKFYSDMYEFREALEYLEKWKNLKPNDAQVYYQLGFCQEKLKNFKSAKENYDIYLSKAPLSPDTEKLRERLSKMSTSDEAVDEEEGLLDKIMKFFSK